jgi:CHAT domain-containing protein
LTTTTAAQQLQSADVFHFHGHGIKDPHDPTKQSLALGEPGSSLSMGEIASLDLASAHVTLIACSGAVQDFSFSLDEPLGLLSAFLLSGASSVIGALWPIQSETGRSFTKIFYEYFLKHIDRSELGPIVNLARALQYTVLELKRHDKTSLPYHWAPFICYGSWFCRRKPGTWQKEADEGKSKTRKRKGRSARFKHLLGSSG